MDVLTAVLIAVIAILLYMYVNKKTATYEAPLVVESEVAFSDDMKPEQVKELFVQVNQKLVTELQEKVKDAIKNSKSKDEIIKRLEAQLRDKRMQEEMIRREAQRERQMAIQKQEK